MSLTNDFNSTVASLVEPNRFGDLAPGSPDESMVAQLDQLTPLGLFPGQRVVDPSMANCCLAGIWLYHDFLDRSHQISQSIPTRDGSYWHAIMHRREGDFSNSKYWMRRVGDHPIFAELASTARGLSQECGLEPSSSFLNSKSWDPYDWIDLCEQGLRSGAKSRAFCERVQPAEWRLLFAHCYHQALGA